MKRRKKLLMVLGGICVFFINNYGYCNDKDRWIIYGDNNEGEFYYYQVNVKHMNKNVVQVWDRMEYSEKGKENEIRWRQRHKLSIDDDDMNLWEINCGSKTRNLVRRIDDDGQKETMDLISNSERKTEPIIPGSRMALLFRKVCPKE